jgi:hypothetical protein
MRPIPQRFIDREVKNRLKEQEKIIRDRMPAIEEAAQAFKTIRDEKLYRLTFKSFDEYCKNVWGFGKDKAYRLINNAGISSRPGSSTSQNATTSDKGGSKLDPGAETQTGNNEEDTQNDDAPPSSGDDEQRGEAGQAAGTATDEPEPLVDDGGKPVPARLVRVFEHASLFRKVASVLDRAASSLKEIEATPAYQTAEQEASKKGGERRDYSSLLLTAARRIEAWRPATVCPLCTGAYEPSPDSDICARCGDKGYLTAEEAQK